jgi:hypothetical protein
VTIAPLGILLIALPLASIAAAVFLVIALSRRRR